jgi:hypothetical protein
MHSGGDAVNPICGNNDQTALYRTSEIHHVALVRLDQVNPTGRVLRKGVTSTAASLFVVGILVGAGILYIVASPFAGGHTETITETATETSTITKTAAVSTEPSISNVLVANVTIGGYPGEIAVNANAGRIYVSDLFANAMTVVSASNHSVMGTITLPGTPTFGIAIDPTRDMVYVPVSGCTNELNVSNSCDSPSGIASRGGIVAINGTTDKITDEYYFNVDRLAIDQSTDVLYGTIGNLNSGSNSSGFLLAIDARSGLLIANTTLSAYPLDVETNAKTNMVYVAACKQISLPCVGAEVLTINGSSHMLQSVTPLNFDALNFNLVVDPSNNVVYTMGEDGENLTLVSVDGTSGRIMYSRAIGSSCAGGGGGTLALSTAYDQIYASFDSNQFFLVIDASSGQIMNMLFTPEAITYSAFNPSTLQAYATTEAQHENVGYLLILPGMLNESYVNASLLQLGICLP